MRWYMRFSSEIPVPDSNRQNSLQPPRAGAAQRVCPVVGRDGNKQSTKSKTRQGKGQPPLAGARGRHHGVRDPAAFLSDGLRVDIC